jgi:uncharacterized protein YbjT (DUF2867 family)
MHRRVLVTGATGQHGSTGAHVVASLREQGVPVRVLARTSSERTASLEALGAEVVYGDFRDRRSLEPAFGDVTDATFTYPVAAGIVEAAANFAAAARTVATPPRVFVMSMAPSHPQSPSPLGRAHWLAEEVLGWAGLAPSVLRVAAFFYENVTLFHAASIRERGVIANSFGDAALPWIAGIDAARLLVRAILDPSLFPPGVHLPPGAELATHATLAERLSSQLGRDVGYESISHDDWKRELLEQARRNDSAVNISMADHITALSGVFAGGKPPMLKPDPTQLATLLGGPLTNFTEFVEAHRPSLSPASSR